MKLKRFAQIFLVSTHVLIAVLLLWHVLVVDLSSNGLVVVVASVIAIAYCVSVIVRVHKARKLDHYTFGLAVLLSVVLLSFVVWYLFGLMQDAAGVQCSFLFGNVNTCTVFSLLYAAAILLQPLTLAIIAALTIPSFISMQRKSVKKKEKKHA